MINTYNGTITCDSDTGVITSPGCQIGSTDTQVRNNAFYYKIAGKIYHKTAVMAGTAVTATVVPIGKYGLFGFQINAAGTISNVDAAANATGYATAAAALAAMPDASANNVIFMYIIVLADTGTWTGATDDLVADSDCAAVYFYNVACTSGQNVDIGFTPSKVEVWNPSSNVKLTWDDSMDDGTARKDAPNVDGLLTAPRVAIGEGAGNLEKFHVESFLAQIAGVQVQVAETTVTKTDEDITKNLWGLYGMQVGADGTIDAAPNATTATGWSTEADAIEDIEACTSAHVLVGYATIHASTSANYEGDADMDGSKVATANYYDAPLVTFVEELGITPIAEGDVSGVKQGFTIGYDRHLWYPGDTLYYTAWR